uniref:TEP1-F n=1 Tax=Anopheles farauti TaxID=69004 RepID=A0A182QG27_9DIPT
MENYLRLIIVILLTICALSRGLLVVGPKVIDSHQEYKLLVVNDDKSKSVATVQVLLEGIENDEIVVNHLPRNVNVPYAQMRSVKFMLPRNVSPSASIKLTVKGTGGFRFHEEIDLELRNTSIAGLVQLDKPVYKPGDRIKFRVIVLNAELKPPADLVLISVKVLDSLGNVIKSWRAVKLAVGVFEGQLQVAANPAFGIWSVTVRVGDEQIGSKTFEVKKHVVMPFDLQVGTSTVPLVKHAGLNLTINAKGHSDIPAKGMAKVKLYLNSGVLDQMQQFHVDGEIRKWFPFNGELEAAEIQQNVRVKVTFIEQHTNATLTKDTYITVYKYPYRAELVKVNSGLSFKYALQCKHHDGTPAKGIAGNVRIDHFSYEKPAITDAEGLIELELNVTAEEFDVHLSYDSNRSNPRESYE